MKNSLSSSSAAVSSIIPLPINFDPITKKLDPEVWALDLETECAIKTCPGLGGYEKCDHALKPHTAKITIIAIWHPIHGGRVFSSPAAFFSWAKVERPKLLGQTLKFDLLMLNYAGGPIPLDRWVHDSHVLGHVHTEKVSWDYLQWYDTERKRLTKERGIKYRKASEHSLKTMAPYFLGVEPFWETKDYANDDYVLKDCKYSYLLAEYFLSNMEPAELAFYQNKALPWAKMLYLAEERGVVYSKKRLQKLKAELTATETRLCEQININWRDAHSQYRAIEERKVRSYYNNMKNQKIAQRNLPKALAKLPAGVDLSSPAQMTWLLRDHLGLDITNFEGDETTGKGVLERLASEGQEDVGQFLKWRKTQKMLTAFIPVYEEWLQHRDSIHSSFNMFPRTGRLSSSSPNLQQVSKLLKPLTIPRPGHKFLTYDLAAIEARLIAYYSGDPALFEIISNGWSIHDYNVKVFFGIDDPIEVIKERYQKQRHAVKQVGFALFYGAGPKRIQETFMQHGFDFTLQEAKQAYANFRSTYAIAKEFHEKITEQFENGETILNIIGRPLKLQPHDNPYMQGFNTLVQSSASDLNLDVAYNVTINTGQCPVLFVHDSITWEVEEAATAKAEAALLAEYDKYDLTTDLGKIKITGEGGVYDEWS